MTNTKSTKRALLMSVLSMFICVVMLAGTTFAWFTDSVTSTNNIIKSGNLDINLEWSKDRTTWENVDADTNVFSTELWEPGHTEVVYLKISNIGSLALRYRLNINVASETTSTNVYGEDLILSKHIGYGVVEDVTAKYETRDAAIAAVGADNFVVLEEPYAPERQNLYPTTNLPAGEASEAIVALVVYMDEDVGNEANAAKDAPVPTINLGINLFASQLAYEEDSYGSDYDLPADHVIAAGEIVTIDKEEIDYSIVNNGVVNITNSTIEVEDRVITTTGEANLNNVVVEGGTPATYAAVAQGEDAVMTLDAVTLTSGGGAIGATDGATVIVNSGEYKVDSASTSGRYLIYTVGEGSTVIVNGGSYSWDSQDNQKRAYVHAEAGTTVIINGGNFGKASTRSGYTSGIKGDGTVIITGGTFGFNPEKWVATGCEAVYDTATKTWTVQAKDAQDAKNDFKTAITEDKKNIVVNLGTDVTFDITAWATLPMGGATTESIVINANGHTITFNQTNSDWNNIVTTNGAKLVINDAHITSTGYNNGPWNRHDLNFACEVELNNVTSDKALALKAGATLNNVAINDANTSDTYAIWIQPNGQTINIDGLVIDMIECTDGRGIKIDEQYVSDPAKVTLNIKNATFKTEEKSAILVKSKAGADITLENVNISDVVADSINPVWVDSDAAAYADLVTVNGKKAFVEGTVTVTNVDELEKALNNGGYIVLENDIVIPTSDFTKGDDPSNPVVSIPVGLLVNSGKDTTIDFNGKKISAEETGEQTALIHVLNTNVTIKGTGDFVQNGTDDDYLIWAKGDSTVTIEGGNFASNDPDNIMLYASDANAEKATIVITGGNFTSNGATAQNHINIRNHGLGKVVITGGTFNFNPDWSVYTDVHARDDAAHITIAYGYHSVDDSYIYLFSPLAFPTSLLNFSPLRPGQPTPGMESTIVSVYLRV